MSTLPAFRAALYARLSQDAGLAAYQHPSMSEPGVQVWAGAVPGPKEPRVQRGEVPKPRYPRIVMRTPLETPFDVLGKDGGSVTYTLDVWDSTEAGEDRVAGEGGVFALIAEALREPFVMDGYGTTRAKRVLAEILPDPNGSIIHGIYRIRKVNL